MVDPKPAYVGPSGLTLLLLRLFRRLEGLGLLDLRLAPLPPGLGLRLVK